MSRDTIVGSANMELVDLVKKKDRKCVRSILDVFHSAMSRAIGNTDPEIRQQIFADMYCEIKERTPKPCSPKHQRLVERILEEMVVESDYRAIRDAS